ncbi:Molybdopterin adenylyltransferase [Thermoplasmatales archaeon]|nr:Molybdopterin adenylyltransferase [Thermoplasmatales archaeon]
MHHPTDNKYNLRFLVITVSDKRTEETDESGKIMRNLIKDAGRIVSGYIIPNSSERIIRVVEEEINTADVFIFIGGTGLGKKDYTSRTLRKISEKEVPGFGEIFRSRSASGEIHSVLSDSSMFVIRGKIVFSIPGSGDAQRIAFDIINDIVDHAYHEIMR